MATSPMYRNNMPGRTTSQISIYDYPEHLNPFYEDDNHKRIRFWKMGSSSNKVKSGRSNSFSFNGLKDMWAFKSFKMKKKSSTLGINKTSESPPMMRHQVHPVYDSYNTVDSRMRHTVNVGLGQPNFQRGANYRSSLQDVHSSGSSSKPAGLSSDNGFYRNNRYRSTMQNGYQTLATPPNRYGSITPTPRSKFDILSHGSSQTSVNSSNPFDDGIDDDNADNISRITTVDGVTVRKSGRKKRRAPPPPPTRISSASSSSSSSSTVTQQMSPNASYSQDITTVNESSREGSGKEDIAEISNLTAEIESFVRIADTDREKIQPSPEVSRLSPEKSRPSPEKSRQSSPEKSRQSSPEKSKKAKAPNPLDRNSPEKVKSPPTSQVIKETEQKILVTQTISVNETSRTSGIRTEPIEVQTIIVENIEIRNRESPEKRTTQPTPVDRTPNASNENNEEKRTELPEKRKLPENTRVSPENNEEYPEKTSHTPDREISPSSAAIQKTVSEKQLNVTEEPNSPVVIAPKIRSSPPKILICEATEDDFLEKQPLPPPPPTNTVTTPRSTEVEFILEEQHEIVKTYHTPEKQIVSELKITESNEDLTEQNPKLENYQIRYVPLKNYIPEPIRRDIIVPKSNGYYHDDEKPHQLDRDNDVIVVLPQRKVPPLPPKRKWSVKDAIASINKSQSLLRINQKPNKSSASTSTTSGQRYNSMEQISQYSKRPSPPLEVAHTQQTNDSNENIIRNVNEMQETERNIQKMISEMEHNNNNHHTEDFSGIPVMVEQFEGFNSEEELFKKCVVRRDKSGMDWNPVPKPRRSRNLTDEVERGKL